MSEIPNPAEVVARVEALAVKLRAEAEPYLPGGSRYDTASEEAIACATYRDIDAERILAALRGDT